MARRPVGRALLLRTAGRAVPGRPVLARAAASAALVAALAVAGCTVSTPGSGSTPGAGDGGPTGAAAPSTDGTGTAGATGEDGALSSEEISARLLGEGDSLAATEPLAEVSAVLEVTPSPTEVTLEVLEVVATGTGTVVHLQLTAPQTVQPQNTTFVTGEIGNTEYPTDMDLLDPTTQERLAPITAADDGRWCQCSFLPSRIGPEPTRLSAGFPALDPGTTTVDLRLGTFPVVEGLPVTR